MRRVPSEDKSIWTFADLGARFLLTDFFGFEDLQIPKSISESLAFDDHLPEEQISVQDFETDLRSESSSEDSSASYNEEQKTSLGSQKPI